MRVTDAMFHIFSFLSTINIAFSHVIMLKRATFYSEAISFDCLNDIDIKHDDIYHRDQRMLFIKRKQPWMLTRNLSVSLFHFILCPHTAHSLHNALSFSSSQFHTPRLFSHPLYSHYDSYYSCFFLSSLSPFLLSSFLPPSHRIHNLYLLISYTHPIIQSHRSQRPLNNF